MHIVYNNNKISNTKVMIVATVAMTLAVLLLIPLQLNVNLYVDLDKFSAVVIIKVYRIVFFDCVLNLEGVIVNYNGSINGSINLVNYKMEDNSGLLKAFDITDCELRIANNITTPQGIYKLCFSNIIASIFASVMRERIVASAVCLADVSNNINVNINLSTTSIAMLIALAR